MIVFPRIERGGSLVFSEEGKGIERVGKAIKANNTRAQVWHATRDARALAHEAARRVQHIDRPLPVFPRPVKWTARKIFLSR